MLNTIAITPKSEDKYVVKVFNSSEFHLSEMTLLQNPYFKILLTGLLIVLAIVGIAFTGITDGDDIIETDVYPVDYFTNILYLFTYIW